MPQHFIGFFPMPGFWIGERPERDRPIGLGKRETAYEYRDAELTLRVSRDGVVSLWIERIGNYFAEDLDFDRDAARLGEYLRYLNCFYLFLDGATCKLENLQIFQLHELMRRDVHTFTFEGDRLVASPPRVERFLARPLSVAVLDEAVRSLREVMACRGAEADISDFVKSLAEYKNGNYPTSVVLAWFVVESTINWLWEIYVPAERKVPPMAAACRRLHKEGAIDEALLNALNEVRDMRNKVAHREVVNFVFADVRKALELSRQMIELRWGIRLQPNYTESI